jgi:nucleotide-binding universal stress UspA family protein
MFNRMLVPLDGSTNAEVVMPYVIALAANTGTDVVLTSVARPGISNVEQLHQAYLERKVEQVMLRLNEYGIKQVPEVSYRVLTGKPAEEIVKHATEIEADLITIASRGASGQVPPLLGHISTSVLWSTEKPVLLIKSAAEEKADKGEQLIKKILLPLDSSHAGEAPVEYARRLAVAFGAELVLLQVLEPVNLVIGFENLSALGMPDNEEIKKVAVSYLTKVEERLKTSDIKTSLEIVWGSAAECILDYADTGNIDLIAMSARGRSDISRWVFGSVAEKILHSGNKPLLMMR